MNTGWNEYWQDENQRQYWTEPDQSAVDLVSRIDKAQIKQVLDLGCGIGRHALFLARQGFQVTALDSSPRALKILEQLATEAGDSISLCAGNYSDDHFASESFDFILAFNVIYHGYRVDLVKAIDLVFKWLKPSGWFFFTCPSRHDAKYNNGEQAGPHTFKPMNSVTPGDMHYFADEIDIADLTRQFKAVSTTLFEHYWQNEGQRQFSSYWRVLATK